MIHYHGTPLSPASELMKLAGRHFCVPFSDPRDADRCAAIGQSIMFDNGAFSAFTRGVTLDVTAYYKWLEPRLGHPHWAVVPDVIDGTEADQRLMMSGWPFPRTMSAPVWHLALEIEYLIEICDTWPRVCFGSSGAYWQVGSSAWMRRADQAFNALAKRHRHLPWIHMLRGLSLAGDRWPFASADSTNIARNFKDSIACPERMARNIDARQCPINWIAQPIQKDLLCA